MPAGSVAEPSDRPPEQFWPLLGKYLDLVARYDEAMTAIEKETQARIAKYFQKELPGRVEAPPDEHEFLRYVDEFVDNLMTYYSYYLATRRSMGTLFASIGITDPSLFAETLREEGDAHVMVRMNDLDVAATKWFLEQFLDEDQAAENRRAQLVALLPQLEEAANVIHSASMSRFLEVLRYVASDKAGQLYEAGIRAASAAFAEEKLGRQVDFVLDAITSLMTFVRGVPAFILTESVDYFGPAELEEFDKKIQHFRRIRRMFKKHVQLHSRSEWVYERHHRALFTSIFDGSRTELMQVMQHVRRGVDLRQAAGRLRDCQGMLLGVAQGNSLFLEYSAYYDQRLSLIEAYKQIADFLQSELLETLYTMEVQRNKVYVEVRDEFKQVLDELQQVLVEACPPDTKRS